MAEVYQCHACGGNVIPDADGKAGACEYCGMRMVFPRKGHRIMNQANALRSRMEFDQAEILYERLASLYPDDPEIWWNILLCRYGILYVQEADCRVITVNRMRHGSVYDEEAYQKAIQNADAEQRQIYEDEGCEIQGIQERLLEAAAREEAYDIFISFKDKDENGQRTEDSVLAQEIYDILDNAGYRVFFSRITLRTALGEEFEPKIFAALQSARMMILVGTTTEHVNADWVRNEWSRYLKIMERDVNKYLLPVYTQTLRPEDLPSQLSGMEGLLADGDMKALGERLLENVNSRFGRKQAPAAPVQALSQEAIAQSGEQLHRQRIQAFVEQGQRYLSKGDCASAKDMFEDALDLDMTCADAWWGKLASGTRNFNTEDDFHQNGVLQNDYMQAIRYASPDQQRQFQRDLERYAENKRILAFNRLLKQYQTLTRDEDEIWLSDNKRFRQAVDLQEQCLQYADEDSKEVYEWRFESYRKKRHDVLVMLSQLQAINKEGEDKRQRVQYLQNDIAVITTRRKEAKKQYHTILLTIVVVHLLFYGLIGLLSSSQGTGVVLLILGLWLLHKLMKRHQARKEYCGGRTPSEEKRLLAEERAQLDEAIRLEAEYNAKRPGMIQDLKDQYASVLEYLPSGV